MIHSLLKRISFAFLGCCLQGCTSDQKVHYLDSAIPRVETPAAQIAVVRTKWWNGKLWETAFLDHQDRVLEAFMYGRSNAKLINHYSGNRLLSRIYYYHSDSSPVGHIEVTKSRFEYAPNGQLKRMIRHNSWIKCTNWLDEKVHEISRNFSEVSYTYTGLNDTIAAHRPSINYPGVAYFDRWEHNVKGQPVRNVKLNSIYRPERTDTISYYSHRLAYDKLGRLDKTWFDLMYLGRFYIPEGPDTIKYRYDKLNRLIREEHQYTLDMHNKREIDTTTLTIPDRQAVARSKHQYLSRNTAFSGSRKDFIIYRYESFVPEKHLPLRVSTDIGY